jgi:carboxyl-terminal processing protease
MAAEEALDLKATVVAMEFACGACYAIDDYTAYLTPNQLRDLTRSLSRTEIIDIGLTLEIRDNMIVLQDPPMDSPAKGAVKANDQLLSVDKKLVVDLPLQTVKEMLKGPAGSFVEIEVLTPGAATAPPAGPRHQLLYLAQELGLSATRNQQLHRNDCTRG